jgi:hypothetical protein
LGSIGRRWSDLVEMIMIPNLLDARDI